MNWKNYIFRDPEEAREFLAELNIDPTEASQALTALCEMQRERIKEMEMDVIRAEQFDDETGIQQARRQLKDNLRRFKILSALRTLAVQADAEAFAAEFAEQFDGSPEDGQAKPTEADGNPD